MPQYRLVGIDLRAPTVFDALDDVDAERQARAFGLTVPDPPRGDVLVFLLEREEDARWRVVRAWVPERNLADLRVYGT